jgi:hypothetical protein
MRSRSGVGTLSRSRRKLCNVSLTSLRAGNRERLSRSLVNPCNRTFRTPGLVAGRRTTFLRAPVYAAVIGAAFAFNGVATANEPCSGRKGGVNHCQGSTFICNDGSVSGSKKDCRSYMGGASLMGSATSEMAPTATGSCPCASGTYCIGPRGGHFCITDDGSKSYLKK